MPSVQPSTIKNEPELNQSSGLKLTFYLLFGFVNVLGFAPWKADKKEGTFSFKLFSFTSVFCFLRLLLFSFPFTTLPLIFWYGGYMDEEWNSFQNETNGNSTMEYDPRSLTEEMVFKFDFYSNYLVLVLPFLFAHSMVEPFQVFNALQLFGSPPIKKPSFGTSDLGAHLS